MVTSTATFFLLFVIYTTEAEKYELTVQDLQLQINKLVEYREKDVHLIESLIAERTEDRRKLEALTRDVQNYQNVISMTLEAVAQNKQTNNLLRKELDFVLEGRENDRKIIQDLQTVLLTVIENNDLRAHAEDENVEKLDKEKDEQRLPLDNSHRFASAGENMDEQTSVIAKAHKSDTDEPQNMTTVHGTSYSRKESVGRLRRLTPPQASEENRAAFTACLGYNGDITYGEHQTLVFDRVFTNYGNHYHGTTGIFTTPADGLYVFFLSAMSSPGKNFFLQITKDGTSLDDMYSDGRQDASYDSVSDTWILNLNAGSEVWIRSDAVSEVHAWCHTQFSGFLLYAL